MKSFLMAVAAAAGLTMFGVSDNSASAHYRCGGYGGYYGGGYGGYYGGGYYPGSYGYYGGGGGWGHHHHGGYYGGWGNSVGFRSSNFGFRARW
jgi:hypothetical protein